MGLLTQNEKMRKTSKITGMKTYNFTLPALRTCPFAGACRKYCYASKGAFNYPNSKLKHEANYRVTLSNDFIFDMYDEIVSKQVDAIRIHDAGDFYSERYLSKWITIINSLPHITFYAYTKSIRFIKLLQGTSIWPDNFTVIFSFGGKEDHLIDVDNDRHAVVYTDRLPDGYSYANDNDHVALARNKKIALKLH